MQGHCDNSTQASPLHVEHIVPARASGCDLHAPFTHAQFPTFFPRPVPSTTSDKDGCRWTTEPGYWFYRYNQCTLEVRAYVTLGVAGMRLHAHMLKETPKDQPIITAATGGCILGSNQVVLSSCDAKSRSSRLWLFSPVDGVSPLDLDLQNEKVISLAISTVCQSENMLATSSTRAPQYLAVGTESSIHLLELDEAIKKGGWDSYKGDLSGAGGKITAMTTYVPPNATSPIIFVGRERSTVELWRISLESDDELEMFAKFRGPQKNVPVTHLRFDGPEGTFRKYGVLLFGQSDAPATQEDTMSLPSPSMTAFYLDERFAKLDTILQCSLTNGKPGLLLALKFSRVGNAHRVFAATVTYRGEDVLSEVQAITVDADSREKDEFARVKVPASDAEQVMDICPSPDAADCRILYLDKVATCRALAPPVGSSCKRKSSDWEQYFQSSTGWFPYQPKDRERILKMRERLDNELFFDGLLATIGINGKDLYPPKDAQQLRDLYDAITTADTTSTQKNCLIMYLIKDWKNGNDLEFSNSRFVSQSPYKRICGFWDMDHGLIQEGVQCLGWPGVKPEFPEKIIKALIMHGMPWDARAFIQAVKPDFTTDSAIRLHMTVLLATNLLEAFRYQRRYQNHHIGDLLWHQLLHYCFQNGTIAKSLACEFLQLPINQYEESLLASYCAKFPTRACRETLIKYYIARARHVEAILLLEDLASDASVRNSGKDDPPEGCHFNEYRINLMLANLQTMLTPLNKIRLELARERVKSMENGGEYVPLSAQKCVRGVAKTAADAQKILLRALRTALPTDTRTAQTTPAEAVLESQLSDFDFMDIKGLSLPSPISVRDEDDDIVMVDSPQHTGSANVSVSAISTPSPTQRFEKRRGSPVAQEEEEMSPRKPKEIGRASFAETLEGDMDVTAQPKIRRVGFGLTDSSSESDSDSEPSMVVTPYRNGETFELNNVATPISSGNTYPDKSQDDHGMQVEHVECHTSPVGPLVNRGPPLRSMSHFSPREDKNLVTDMDKNVKNAELKAERSRQRRFLDFVEPTPVRKSGRLAAKQAERNETPIPSQLGVRLETPIPNKTKAVSSRTMGRTPARVRPLLLDEDTENIEITKPSTRKKPVTSSRPATIHNETRRSAPLGERNAPAPSTTRKGATAAKTPARKMAVPATPGPLDDPMTLDELSTPLSTTSTTKSVTASRRKTIGVELGSVASTRSTKKTRAAPAVERTIVTRRMAKQMETEGGL
ncbi:hypothetical protein SpCBS45565_g03770 [Spizellomyces sp. 'palustris']|nr:hypothetical protein SpCBS45565_g03770 [Spizellomyces sp. 'palustris']